MIGMKLVFHLRVSGRSVRGSLHCRLFPQVAMVLRLTKRGSQHVACSCREHVRLLVRLRERIRAIRVEIRLLPPSLAGEQGLGANS